MDTINNHFLQITGKVNIPTPLEIDTEYQFTGIIATYGEYQGSNQDGTCNVTHRAKFCDEIVLIKGEQIIRGKNKTTNSQKLRQAVYARGHDYNDFSTWLMGKLDDLFMEYEMKQSTNSIDYI